MHSLSYELRRGSSEAYEDAETPRTAFRYSGHATRSHRGYSGDSTCAEGHAPGHARGGTPVGARPRGRGGDHSMTPRRGVWH